MDLVDAQARAALRGVRLGAAGVHPHAAPAQRRQVARSPSARTRCRSTTTATPASSRGAAQLPRPDGLVVRRRPREVHPRRDDRGVLLGPDVARRAGVRPREADAGSTSSTSASSSHEQLADARCSAGASTSDYLARLLPLVRERIKRLDEFVPATEFFFSGDLDYAPVLAELAIPEVAPARRRRRAARLRRALRGARRLRRRRCSRRSRAQSAEARGWKTKERSWCCASRSPARKASPPLFETMEVLGKELTRRRLRQAADVIGPGRRSGPARGSRGRLIARLAGFAVPDAGCGPRVKRAGMDRSPISCRGTSGRARSCDGALELAFLLSHPQLRHWLRVISEF